MRVLGPIIQISALSVLHVGKQFTLSDAIAPQLVGHDHPRDILQTLPKPPGEALGGTGIAPGLHKNVEHNAILIDGTPQIVLHALDCVSACKIDPLNSGLLGCPLCFERVAGDVGRGDGRPDTARAFGQGQVDQGDRP
jgi:hypothetical protein